VGWKNRSAFGVLLGGDSKVAKCRGRQFSDGCKQLRSSSEVECFRVQFRDGLLVKRFESAKPTHFVDLRRVSTPICGPQSNEDACFRSETLSDGLKHDLEFGVVVGVQVIEPPLKEVRSPKSGVIKAVTSDE